MRASGEAIVIKKGERCRVLVSIRVKCQVSSVNMSKRRKLERPTHVLSCLTIVAAMPTSQLAHAEHANADGAADSDVEALLAMMQADEQAANAEERTLEQEAAMMQATREEAATHGVNE